MRLIDADKLEEKIDDISRGYTSVYGVEEDDIYNAETVEAIPLDWIRAYINNLKDMGVQLSLRDAQAVSVMVDKWAMEQNGNATCGPDYCEIGGTHND